MSASKNTNPVSNAPNTYQKSNRGGTKDKILNKAASDRQITAEQILREAYERRTDEVKRRPTVITNPEELSSYKLSRRIEFEENLRRQPHSINCWLRYAKFEEKQGEWERARSVFERALNIDYRNPTIWLKYTEFEMKNQFPGHARNVWDRAVELLPRVDQFWYKYALMEERLGNIDRSRVIFERWMKWDPPVSAWESYIKLEMRCGGKREDKVGRARMIWEKLADAKTFLSSYLNWAKFEEKFGNVETTRNVYTEALKKLGDEAHDAKFFSAFADFEKRAKETDRARAIYKFALDNVPKAEAEKLFEAYSAFEKQTGSRSDIDSLVLSKKRFFYEEKLKTAPTDYDAWFDYLSLEESAAPPAPADPARALDLYERAVAALPPASRKALWARYVFLWLCYAAFVEKRRLFARAREIYRQLLALLPHERFTFASAWLQAAAFELRRLSLRRARALLGQALGRCPQPRLFRGYIEMETKLLRRERCRRLYERWLETAPESAEAWHGYAEMEAALGEAERCRAIFELGVGQETLDQPEVLWERYIGFEVGAGNEAGVQALFERLLDRTKNFKVWTSYAETMLQMGSEAMARDVYARGDAHFKAEGVSAGAERNEVLRAWLAFERRLGHAEKAAAVEKRLPREVKRRRIAAAAEQSGEVAEEYIEFVFPDAEDSLAANLRLLSLAHKWKGADVGQSQ